MAYLRLIDVLAVLAFAATAVAGPVTERGPKTCPASNCYADTIAPQCQPGKLCSDTPKPATACPWECEKPVPQGCQPRCQPCRAEVCPLICICEIICTSGPCRK